MRLFLEIIPLADKFALKRKWFIRPKAPEPYEIRCKDAISVFYLICLFSKLNKI